MGSSRRPTFGRSEDGQALVVVGLALVVLMLALAFGIDWGYGLTQRRVMQNAADSGALAAARLLARSVILTSSGVAFASTTDGVSCAALALVESNRQTFRPDASGRTETMKVQWSSNLSAADPWGESGSTTGGTFPPVSAATCAADPVISGLPVLPGTRFIRVQADVTYRTLIGGAVGSTNRVEAGAHAVAAIRGNTIPANGPSWPMTRHYTREALTEQCGTPCNPTTAAPVVFWSSGGGPNDVNNDVDYGTFHGMVDYSRYSPLAASKANELTCYTTPAPAGCVGQLISHWDDSGPPAAPLPNLAAASNASVNCNPDRTKWITWGDDIQRTGSGDKVAGDDTQCSLPNWTTKPFSNDANDPNTGRLSLDSTDRPPVDTAANRPSVCSAATRPPGPLESPSCAVRTQGDWVETQGGNTGQKLAKGLAAYIDANGTTDPTWSEVVCTSCPGNPKYGKYVVMLVSLWDCAQTYDSTSKTWTLVEPKSGSGDCADIHSGGDLGSGQTIDRVHLFTKVPFTFYRGLVNSSSIQGFWGGLVTGDAACPTCVVNAFSNSVLLVADPSD